jgi:(2Fe-2S) ferredoxin
MAFQRGKRELYRAYICCGPNCGPKGSGTLLDFLADEVERLGLSEEVTVLPTGCQSHCDSGPTMVVYPGPVYYQEVDAGRLRRIIDEHFVAGRPVQEYFWMGVKKKILTQHERRAAWVIRQAEWPAQPDRPSPNKPKREKPAVDDFKW